MNKLQRDLDSILNKMESSSSAAKTVIEAMRSQSSSEPDKDVEVANALASLRTRLEESGVPFEGDLTKKDTQTELLLALISQLLEERNVLREAFDEDDTEEDSDENDLDADRSEIQRAFKSKLDEQTDYINRQTFCTSNRDYWRGLSSNERYVQANMLVDYYHEHDMPKDAGLPKIINTQGAKF